MNPWKLIIEQVESGYAVYRFAFVWDGRRPCPYAEARRSDGKWHPTWQDAGAAADAYRKNLPH